MSVPVEPQPRLFGPPARRLLGMYHPAEGPAREAAVLLCNPVGWEALAAQRGYRRLAERLARAGLPVLRFDYDGTGDSAGDDRDPGRVAAWQESLRLAAAELRALSGAERLAVVGVHLGATLAATVPVGAESAVLWAPFVQGRQFVRQLRAYRALNPGRGGLEDGAEEAAGFLFSAETLADLGKLDLGKLPPPAPRVLLLRRDEHSPEPRLAEAWRTAGAEVSCAQAPGYERLMQEPRKSVLEPEAAEAIASWLEASHPERSASAASALGPGPEALEGPGFREVPHRLGPGGPLGLLTLPETPRSGAAAVVFLNTAEDHRVGPNRMYVSWARALAAQGTPSLRFDPAGVGDGPAPADPADVHPYSDRRLRDARAALDWLEARGVAQRFRLVGLCSGAYFAFHLGAADPRVVGEVLINPQTFFWHAGDSLEIGVRQSVKATRFYQRAVLQPETWRRLARGEVNAGTIARALAKRVARSGSARVTRNLPGSQSPGRRLLRGLRAALDRGGQVRFVFSADDGGIDYVEGLLGPGGGRLQRRPGFALDIVPGPDHTFSSVLDQRDLFARLAPVLAG